MIVLLAICGAGLLILCMALLPEDKPEPPAKPVEPLGTYPEEWQRTYMADRELDFPPVKETRLP
jgi:hypothetical protein